jgi:DNA-binding NarL/FixJ family response regulator
MSHKRNCVLLADQHAGLRDSVRGLLETQFDIVFMVATETSLLDGADRLNPAVVVVDLSLSAGDLRGLLSRITDRARGAKVLLLSVHDERTVAESALAAGAHAVVLKRSLATDLMPAVAAVLAGGRYLSPGIAPGGQAAARSRSSTDAQAAREDSDETAPRNTRNRRRAR